MRSPVTLPVMPPVRTRRASAGGAAVDQAVGGRRRAPVAERAVPADGPGLPPVGQASERVFVGLGANLGDPVAQLRLAVAALQAWPHDGPDLRVVGVSSLYRTAPWEAEGPDFFNAVVALDGRAEPVDVLRALQALENLAGRQRPYRNAPRTLDLDLLLHGDRLIRTPDLTVPHPRARERAFVCVPLMELDPTLNWPDGGGRLVMPSGPQAIERVADSRWPHGASVARCPASSGPDRA